MPMVTCSHHLTMFEVGASYSMPLSRQVSISYPRLPGGSIFGPETSISFFVRIRTYFPLLPAIYSVSFLLLPGC